MGSSHSRRDLSAQASMVIVEGLTEQITDQKAINLGLDMLNNLLFQVVVAGEDPSHFCNGNKSSTSLTQ